MRRDRLRCGEGGVREEMHAYSLFVSRFVQFFFGGWGAIFALAVSIQLKFYLSPSHLHLRYFLVSRALAWNLL